MKIKILLSLFVFCSMSLAFLPFNNTHLENLSEWFMLENENVKAYWVYAENKENKFEPIGAINEGDFCVDDVARVVLLYSEAYELTKNDLYLYLASDAAKFVIKMQASDGEFYNFAYKDGTINKYGITSSKSSGWWTLRAFWGLTKLAKFVKDENINQAIRKAYNAIRKKVPTASDQLALYILGLSNYYELTKSPEVLKDINTYALELLNYEIKQLSLLQGFFSVYKDKILWNGWGNHSLEALIEAYKVTNNKLLLETAKKSVLSQSTLLISTGLIYSIQNYVKLYPELAYALECIAVPLVKLFEITKDEQYALLSSLAISWLFGGNRLGVEMFGKNGEGYDGLEYMHYNKNSGAESTICSLRTILYGKKLSEYYQLLAIQNPIKARFGLIVLEAESFDIGITSSKIILGDYGFGSALMIEGRGRIKKSGIESGSYIAFVAGSFSNTTVTLVGKTSLKKELNGNGIFELGKIEIEDSFGLSNTNNCLIDQVILLPTVIGVSFDFPDSKSVVYDVVSGKLNIHSGQLFKRKAKDFSFEAIVGIENVQNYILLNLTELYNNDGIATPLKPGNFDNLGAIIGAYLPEEEIPEGISNIIDIPFFIKTVGLDNIRCDGQVIHLPEELSVKSMHILAAANHGDYETKILTDKGSYSVKIKDWCISPSDIVFDYRYTSSSEKQYIKCGLNVYTIHINETIKKIILPNQINIHIFSITLEK